MKTIKVAPDGSELRRRAEEKLKEAGSEDRSGVSPETMASLVHELEVHQIELEMQNEELRRIQEELEISRDKYSHLYDFAPAGYFTMSEKGIIEEVNLTGATLLGIERSALIRKPFSRFVRKDDQDVFYKHRQRLLETEKPQSCELRLVKKNGDEFYVRMESLVIKNRGEALRQIRAAVSDITERKIAEGALLIITHDLRQRIKELNCLYTISDLREKPGISLEEIFLGVVDILSKSWQFPEIACARISMDGETYETENFEETQWKQVSDIPVDGKPIGRVEVYYLEERPGSDEGPFLKGERTLIDTVAVRLGRVVNYTQVMKELQKANESLEDRVQIRTNELRKRTEQLSKLALQLTLAEERERLRIAEMLHDDLQQLLVAAKIRLEIFSARLEPDRQQDINRILELVVESIKKSRVMTAELSPPVLKLPGLVPALEWLAEFVRQTHGLSVELELDGRVAILREDFKVLLFQCVRELLLNAIKHAGVSSIRLSMAVDDSNNVCIAVKDKGVGFDPDAIWENKYPDVGFGLFSIKERLALIGGCLKVDSAPGKGTTCRLIVPLIEDERQ